MERHRRGWPRASAQRRRDHRGERRRFDSVVTYRSMSSNLLVVDVGNTNIVLGIYRDDLLVNSWRMATARDRTADEYGIMTKLLIGDALSEPIDGAIVSSVVPPLN